MASSLLPKPKTDLEKPLSCIKIIKLFTNKHTCDLYDRQTKVLERVCRHNQGGFKIQDLPYIHRLISLACDNLHEGRDSFCEPLCGLITLCGKPFVRLKANDEFRNTDVICDTLVVLANMLNSSVPKVQLTAGEALIAFAKGHQQDHEAAIAMPGSTGPGSRSTPDDLRPSPWSFNHQLLDRSGVVKIVVESLRRQVAGLRPFGVGEDAAGDTRRIVFDGSAGAGAGGYARSESDFSDASGAGGGGGSGSGGGGAFSATGGGTGGGGGSGGSGGAPSAELLVTLCWLLRELSLFRANACTLTREGTPRLLVQILESVVDFRRPVVATVVATVWNLLEHSGAAFAPQQRHVVALSRASLLDKHRHANALCALGNVHTVGVLRSLLERLLVAGYKRQDKELRNEVVIVASILAARPRNAPFFHATGFLSLLLLHATAPHMGLPTPADPHNYATTGSEDFEFKRLLWSLLAKLVEDEPQNLALAAQSPLMDTLLSVLDPERSRPHTDNAGRPSAARTTLTTALGGSGRVAVGAGWAPTQLAILRAEALWLLRRLVPLCPRQFARAGGLRISLAFLRTSGASAELREGALRLLLAACTTLSDFQSELGSGSAVQAMLDIFTAGEATATERLLSVSVLSKLCAGGHKANQTEFRRQGGVEALRARMDWRPEHAVMADGEAMVAGVVDALWSCVVGSRRSEARFLSLDGVDALLDLLEGCPRVLRAAVLGCTADLLAHNRKVVPFFRAWKSQSRLITAPQLLLGMWVEEEERRGVPSSEGGVLCDPNWPLSGAPPNQNGTPSAAAGGGGGGGGGGNGSGPLSPATSGPASPGPAKFARLRHALAVGKGLASLSKDKSPADLAREAVAAGDLRVKLYAVLSSVGMDTVKDAIADMEKDLFGARNIMESRSRLALCVAEQYATFRRGEAWLQLRLDMESEGVRPVSADVLRLEEELSDAYAAAVATADTQRAHLREQQGRDAQEEEAFFDGIRLQQEQEVQAMALKRRSHASKGNMAARLEAKAQKAEMLKRSLMKKATLEANSPAHGPR